MKSRGTYYLEIAKLILFYLLIGAITLFAPFGPIPSYLIIIVFSLIGMVSSGILFRAGRLLPGALAGTLAMCAVFLIILAAGGASVAGVRADALSALLWGILTQIFVATGEELSFRHFIFADLDLLTSRKAAAVISSVGFAAMHIPSLVSLEASLAESAIALVSIFVASLLLTFLFVRWGLLAAIGFHFTWNLLQYNVFGFSYLDSVLQLTKTGSTLLTGGIFGPEASIPGLIVVTATLVGLWFFFGRSAPKAEPEHK